MPSPDVYTSGSGTWVAPANVTAVLVECWGPGGNGYSTGSNPYAGGGGGGAYASKIVTVVPGNGYAYSVGSPGNSTTFNSTEVVADYGRTGLYWPSSASGGLAANSTGTTKYSGGNGGIGNPNGAGGGGSAGPAGAGNNGASDTPGPATGGSGNAGSGGAGGSDPGGAGTANTSGGGGGGGAANNGNGGNGGAPGGGGGGGENAAGTGANGRIVITYTLPTVTTQAVSSIGATTATGNGNITAIGSASPTERGVVYSTTSHGDPGNVAPASSSYSGVVNETGTFSTGAFTESLTGLTSRTTYYARAYAMNTAGYSYGAEVSFTTIGFTNPGNVYTSDNTYATLAATSGVLSVEISKDAGANWSTALTKTFGAADTLETYGSGSTELWGLSLTRADMVDANFRVRVSHGSISQVYKTFGFATGTDVLTGVEIAIEAKYATSTISIDLIKVKIYYGTSILPVQAGSQAFASDGRKNGEGAGAGTGVLVYYDGNAWKATDTGATVAA